MPARRFVMPRLLPRRLRSLHTLVLVLLLGLCGWLGWVWYRGSSFVRVEHVTVTGLSGPDVRRISTALTDTALRMTTLNIDVEKLEAAVSQYAFVEALTVTSHGAHDVSISVDERVPVAYVSVGGRRQLVDADGLLLPSTTARHGSLPVIPLAEAPSSDTITAPAARAAVAVLAAAPYRLLGHVTQVTSSSAHGAIVQLRQGPALYFGPSSQLARKWIAAVAVLQSRYAAGAAYIDLTDPERPAPGVAVSPDQAAALGLASAGTSGTGNTTSSTG